MEKEEGQRLRTLATTDNSDPVGPMTTLSRSSSEPASLSSGGDEAPPAGTDLLERTSRSIAALQHALAAERERCRQLAAELESARRRTVLTPATFDAILHCIEHERSENRQLHGTVSRQHKTITKQRRRLRMYQLRANVDDDSVSSEDLDDTDDSVSEFEMVSVHPECSDCIADNDHRMVIRSQSDDTVSSRSRISCPCLNQPSAAKSPVDVVIDVPVRADADWRAADDDADTLRRRLRDTVETCQRLATALDARHASSTTQDVGQTSASNQSTHTGQLLANVDKQTTEDDIDMKQTSCSAVDISTTYKAKLSTMEARLKEVEEMNARWQCYVEQREKYTRALEQRCSELEQAASQRQQQEHHCRHHRHHPQQQLTDELQRRIDQVLLDQRQKTELAEEARLEAETQNRQLQAQLKQQRIVQDQNKVCIEQLLSRLQDAEGRLQEADAVRRLEQNTAEALRQQVNAYREDFEGERLDRHRAQERVVNLERQLAALKHQVGAHESSNESRSSSHRSRRWHDAVSDSEGSLPLLIARGDPSSFPGDSSSAPRPATDPAPRSY